MSLSRVRLEIDTAALRSNFAEIRRLSRACRVTAVIKANAYGTGDLETGSILRSAGANRFAVADVVEAQRVSALGLPVQILGTLISPEECDEVVRNGFFAPVTGLVSARMLSAAAVKQQKSVPCQVKVDSGMGRFGMDTCAALSEIEEISRLPGLDIRGIYSHLSSAGTPENDYTLMQLKRFKELLFQLNKAGIFFEDVHLSASNGICFYPETCQAPFTMTRSGIIMYGCEKDHLEADNSLKSVLSLKSCLASVKRIRKGEGIGYGHTFLLPEDTLVGTVPAGYADGIPLALSNAGSVLVKGVRCPVIGRVCMDCTLVSLNDVPDAAPGDEVIYWGRSGEEEITPGDWAALKSTHVHDILCAIGNRVERRYL